MHYPCMDIPNSITKACFDLINYMPMHNNGCTVSIFEIVFSFPNPLLQRNGDKDKVQKLIFLIESTLSSIQLLQLFDLINYTPALNSFCVHS